MPSTKVIHKRKGDTKYYLRTATEGDENNGISVSKMTRSIVSGIKDEMSFTDTHYIFGHTS